MQSELLQQAVDPMQELLVVQTLLPAAHPQMPPGPEHVWPLTEQSELVQQSAFEMQALLAAQTR